MSVHDSTGAPPSLDPVENTTHIVLPGSARTLCAEPIETSWERIDGGDNVEVNCAQCWTNHYWGPVEGRFPRGATTEIFVEPRPPRLRRNVTGDDDPRRGRLARSHSLQICLTCFELRGPYNGFDNVCRCDRQQWDRDPKPRYGDLTESVHLCKACVSAVVASGTRWSPFYCSDCRPAVVVLGELAGRCIVPYGPHSIMNDTYWRSKNGRPMTMAQAVAFADQLQVCFANQTTLQQRVLARTAARVESFGLSGHAVLVSDYLDACAAHGFTPHFGFIEFVGELGEGISVELAEMLWSIAHEDSRNR